MFIFNKNVLASNSGFTLIEVVIAMTIFSIGLLGLAKLQTSASMGNHSAFNLTGATIAASNQIEAILAQDFDNVASGAYSDGEFSINYTVDSSVPNLKTIILSVTRHDTVDRTNTFEVNVANLNN